MSIEGVLNPVTAYWLNHYVRKDMCSLCGQSGIIDTRSSAVTATGLRCGAVHFCICPNGQSWRETKYSAEELLDRSVR